MEKWITIGCFGTLIDRDAGLVAALSPLLPPQLDHDALLERFGHVEAELQYGPYRPWSEVVEQTSRWVLAECGRTIPEGLPSPIRTARNLWRPFPEAGATMRTLREQGYRLAVLSNVDREVLEPVLAASELPFDLLVCSDDVQSFKPATAHWKRFLDLTGASRERVVHVGAGLYRDVFPAAGMGLKTVLINRNGTPVLGATPSLTLPDLTGLPDAIRPLAQPWDSGTEGVPD